MNVERLNLLGPCEASREFYKCCAARSYSEALAGSLPVASAEQLLALAESLWWQASPEVWLEAFRGHPKIGDIDSLREKYGDTRSWSESEQSTVGGAGDKVLGELKELNERYEKRFGFIFIVCATGKSAEQMLEILRARLDNSYDDELKNAADEQLKITKLRLERL